MTTACPRCGAINRGAARFCNSCGYAFPQLVAQVQPMGTVLQDRYKLTRVLGQGGMGAVYLAEHLNLQSSVAVKEMLDNFATPAERARASEQFQAEAKMLNGLRHVNLPHVYDYFSERGLVYLVMDYIEGETLEQRLKRATEFFPEPVVLEWAYQLCDVLDYLHQQNPPIIFRDLKPANIMLENNRTIKLIDFGIARLFNPGKTTDTVKMGTVGYAPPEQYGAQAQTTPQSDIYALGATLHHLMTRRDPSVQPFVFPPARSINPAISQNTAAVIARAVEHDPRKRFQSALEMKHALQNPAARTVICPQCGTPNVATEIYCQRCARQLAGTRACSFCHRTVPENVLFCPECGKKF